MVEARHDAPTARALVARIVSANQDQWFDAARRYLTPEELTGATSRVDPRDRTAHVSGRALIRMLASEFSGRHPNTLRVAVTDNGKPYFADIPELWVSIAHSGGVVVAAASADGPVGVDVEQLEDTKMPPLEVAARRFARAESDYFAALDPARVPLEFLRFWTAKEAVGKALGVGIIPSLSGAVFESKGERLQLTSVWIGPAPAQWSLHQFQSAAEDECLTVVVAAPDVRLAMRNIEPQELSS